MYHRFYNRVIIRGILTAQSALYIGAGQESFKPAALQGSILKNQMGEPYLPGSSLKGVMRSFLESVLNKGCERGEGCKKKMGLDAKANRKKKIDFLLESNPDENGEELLAEYIESKSCLSCRLFGSGLMAGKVKCQDALLSDRGNWLGTELRTGNAIDRDTHTAAGGALFDTETIPAGTKFTFQLVAENLAADEANYLGELLFYFSQGGILVGGRSRSGLGQISVEETHFDVYHQPETELFPIEKKGCGFNAPGDIYSQLDNLEAFAAPLREKLDEKGDK